MAKTIAPRLSNGDSRLGIGHRLPANIKDGLRAIAARENKSVSWVIEEVIIAYFGMRTPRYRKQPKR